MTVTEWGNAMAEKKQWLFHMPTFAIGPVEKFFDGESTKFEGANGAPIDGPVIQLLTGHSLMADPKLFIELSEKEVNFYLLSQAKLGSFLKGAAMQAAQSEMPQSTAVTLLVTVLKTQVRAFEMAAQVLLETEGHA